MDEEERKSKVEAGKAQVSRILTSKMASVQHLDIRPLQLLKFQKKKAKSAKSAKKKRGTGQSAGLATGDSGASEPVSLTEDSKSVITASHGADTGHHTPGSVSPLPFDAEVRE